MADKKVLVILLLLAFHVFFLQNLGSRTELLVGKARLLERKIQHEKELTDRDRMSEDDLARLVAAVAFNRSLVFPAEENVSTAMARLQQQVKEAGAKSGVRLSGLRAGEPQEVVERLYARLPLSFTVIGSPEQAGQFLVELFRLDSYLRIFTADLRAKRDNRLHLVISVAAYRLLPAPPRQREVP